MLVTVPRLGWWMARWEQAVSGPVRYAAAVVFDLDKQNVAQPTSAAPDRLTHHAHTPTIRGDS